MKSILIDIILKEIRKMKEPELTDHIYYIKEAVTRVQLLPELTMAVNELKDEDLLRRIRSK